MPTVSIWSGVAVAVQSALIAADTITAITKANPGVVSSTAHGIANGAYVLITAAGMTQVDGRVFRVANQTANTFELEGENTTNYDTFTSGTAQEITFGTTLSVVAGLDATGGEWEFSDITTIHDQQRKQAPTVASAAVFNFDCLWDPADTGLAALRAASNVKAQRCFRFTFATGQKVLFNGYVGCTMLPGGSAQDKVTTKVAITMLAGATTYAT